MARAVVESKYLFIVWILFFLAINEIFFEGSTPKTFDLYFKKFLRKVPSLLPISIINEFFDNLSISLICLT